MRGLNRHIVRVLNPNRKDPLCYATGNPRQIQKEIGDVAAPQRLAAVIQNVRRIAVETGALPDVVEEPYRILIPAFIKAEHAEHQRLRPNVSSE
jgi:hypothetical protein